MSITLFASNDVNRLGLHLSQSVLQQYSQIDSFAPIQIVTQTEGMNVWLKNKLAEQLGISANIKFHSPQGILQYIYEILGGKKISYLSKESIQWILFEELNAPDFINNPSFEKIKNFCHGEPAKRLSLAGELTDLFDQYTIYRYDLIEKWNQSNDPAIDFQEYLWRKLKTIVPEELNDKTVIRNFIIDKLKNSSDKEVYNKLSALKHIYFFGLSIFTPYHMEIFKGLSECLDIQFYFHNPCPSEYWYEDKPEKVIRWLDRMNIQHSKIQGNNLLTNWGRIIQESFYLFLDCDETVNGYYDEKLPVSNPQKLLGKIQQQIIDNETTANRSITIDHIKDGSLNIQSSYTKRREVEALYNYLVEITEKDKSITGRDIVVSCNIDEYAPFIRAIFDTAPMQFKYTIADSTYAQGDNPIQALKSFLLLNEENFNAEEILQLLEFSSVRQKFSIDNIELIRTIIKNSLFRFGIEGKQFDDSYLFSLKESIQKIIYGITLRTNQLYNGFYPLDILEGIDSLEGIKFCLFAETIVDLIKQRNEVRNLQEWTSYIENVLDKLLFDDQESDERILRYQDLIIQNIGKLNCVVDFTNEKISYHLFASHFIQMISNEKRQKLFVSHGITFCSFIPMRSLPFKVVCMLGMDFDKFPRKDNKLSFSHIDGIFRSTNTIIKSKRRRGDRNIRENDKHLFLENLMSAKEYFYLSYIGNSSKDNSIIPPSIIIDELINYIADHSEFPETIRKEIIVRHPLHTFSTKYNEDNPRLINYLIEKKNEFELTPTTNSSFQVETPIQLKSLIDFFKNPIKYYYRKTLGIYFEKSDSILPTAELFELDSIGKWSIKKKLLESDTAINIRELIVKGELPIANMGTAVVENTSTDLQKILTILHDEKKNVEKHTIEVNLQIDSGKIISGKIDNVYGNKLLSYTMSSSTSKRKDSIEHVIKYLCLRASGQQIIPAFVNSNNKIADFQEIDPLTAKKHLSTLIEMFTKGHQKVYPLYLEFDIAPSKIPDINDETAFNDFVLSKKDSIDDHFDDCYDDYAMNLYHNHYFDDLKIIKELIVNTKIVYEIIQSIHKKTLI